MSSRATSAYSSLPTKSTSTSSTPAAASCRWHHSPEIADRTVVINGVSKAYAMTGWRIGYCAAPVEIAKAVTKLQGQYTSGASSIAQKAAEAAYTGPQECVEEMREAFERRRDLVVRPPPARSPASPSTSPRVLSTSSRGVGLTSAQPLPDGRRIETSGDLAMYLLDCAHVATVDGDAFSAPGYIRLSYATSDRNLTEALDRIARALAKLH